MDIETTLLLLSLCAFFIIVLMMHSRRRQRRWRRDNATDVGRGAAAVVTGAPPAHVDSSSFVSTSPERVETSDDDRQGRTGIGGGAERFRIPTSAD